MQWTGIQVEPNVQTFNKLQMARPNSIQINAVIVGDSDKSEYFFNPHTMRLSKKKKNFKRIKTIYVYDVHTMDVKFDALFIDVEGNELDIISSKSFWILILSSLILKWYGIILKFIRFCRNMVINKWEQVFLRTLVDF